ncbi:MAG: hypothetical protein GKR96_03080 [Gammaproteobacteria bacterium]|nr:hypothetical protein [Gammaproteobacteria bacterium]
MGLGALLMVAGSFYLGWLLYREYRSKHSGVLLLSAALGLTMGSVLTVIVAGLLSSSEYGYLADNTQSVMRMPMFGWYLDGRDFRIPHFFATHMMQLIPMYGFYLSRGNRSITKSKARLYWVTAVYNPGDHHAFCHRRLKGIRGRSAYFLYRECFNTWVGCTFCTSTKNIGELDHFGRADINAVWWMRKKYALRPQLRPAHCFFNSG